MIPGIDVSHWQGTIDWEKVAQSGVKFAFIKATEFPLNKITVYVDTNLKKNINGAMQNGILFGTYHFYRTHIDPIIQAQVFCQTVGEFPSLPPVLDLEVAGKKGTILNEQVSLFMREVEKITYRRPIIYTSGGFWRSYMMYNRRLDTDWASMYPLWLAQFTTAWPSQVYPWIGWDFWQYSDKGRLPGIPGSVDLNWYIGTLDELKNNFASDKCGQSKSMNDPLMRVEEQEKNMVKQPAFENRNLESLKGENDDDWLNQYFFNQTGL